MRLASLVSSPSILFIFIFVFSLLPSFFKPQFHLNLPFFAWFHRILLSAGPLLVAACRCSSQSHSIDDSPHNQPLPNFNSSSRTPTGPKGNLSHKMAMMTVYEVQYKRLPAFHAAIYIHRDHQGGLMYHAVGSHTAGFRYEACGCERPEKSRSLYRMWPKGKVAQEDLPRVDLICQNVPIPCIRTVSGVRMERDCRHWVYEALSDLRAAGVLQEISQTK